MVRLPETGTQALTLADLYPSVDRKIWQSGIQAVGVQGAGRRDSHRDSRGVDVPAYSISVRPVLVQ